MTWFRAGSSVAKLAIRRTLSQSGAYAARPRVASSGTRSFHTTVFKSKAQSAPVPRAVPLSRLTDSFLDGTSSVYLEELQRAWENDPSSVDESWDNFFKNFVGQAATSPGISGQTIQESMRLLLLVRAYQVYGHMKAKIDPLGLEKRKIPDDLDPAFYGFSEADLDREFFLGVWRMSGFLSENRPVQTLRSILTRLDQAYSGSIGYEYMHIADRERCNWLRDRIETPTPTQYNSERREVILDRLIWSTQFENFLATKWTAAKRFGLEGGETLIPGMKEMFDRASDLGVESIVIGMSHRGRLNVLGNVVRKPLRQIFSEFSGGTKPVDEVGLYTGTGDVKYHLGTSYDRPTRGGKRIHLSLVANPSHLEAVDPVVIGKTRAKQYYSNDVDRTKNMGILIHGDGSFPGQGVVYETLHLSGLPNYTTGGTIRIVVNNQVAFTTDPQAGRSSQYCTDVAKALDAPIFHVNGDDVEAVAHACELAAEWRQTFHSDVVVDIVCYRRFGHSEIDEPSFTQPKMYKIIRNHPSSLEIYQKKLLESGLATKENIDAIQNKVTTILNEEFLASKDYVPQRRDWLSAYWTGFKSPEQLSRIRNTGVKPEILENVGKAITTLPCAHPPLSPQNKLAIRRTLSQSGAYAARPRVASSGTRSFHTTVFKSKAQSAPVPRAVPLSRLTDRHHTRPPFLDEPSMWISRASDRRAWENDSLYTASIEFKGTNFFKEYFDGQAATSPGIRSNIQRVAFVVACLRSILTRLDQAYSGSIGYEYMHIADRERCLFGVLSVSVLWSAHPVFHGLAGLSNPVVYRYATPRAPRVSIDSKTILYAGLAPLCSPGLIFKAR
ncbi:2-oxoglutarate dehydrogenase, mitochondrial-like protein [Tanacetum coccineum]